MLPPARNTEGDNMAMNKLIDEVKDLIEKEYGRAGAKFGLTNHSDHESYAVLLEEFQEAQAEAHSFEHHMKEFWECVKGDYAPYDKFVTCVDMEKKALLCACEMIQVAAMSKKAAMTICERGNP